VTAEEIAAALDSAAGPVARGGDGRRGRRPSYASFAEAYDDQSVTVEDGHLHWTGATAQGGTPVVAVNSQVETAYRVAFRAYHGREPVGQVRPTCTYSRCVAGSHLADRTAREAGRS
jgi:hypothetical protein